MKEANIHYGNTKPSGGELNYNGMIDITTLLDTLNDTYTFTKSGVVNVITKSDHIGENWYYLNRIVNNTDLGWCLYHRTYETSYPGVLTTEIRVNAGDTLKVGGLSYRSPYAIKFIPFND